MELLTPFGNPRILTGMGGWRQTHRVLEADFGALWGRQSTNVWLGGGGLTEDGMKDKAGPGRVVGSLMTRPTNRNHC